MSRFVLISFLVVCLVCFVQAFPQAAEPQPTPGGQIEQAVNGVLESLQKGLQGIMNDPGLNQLVKDGQAALANAAETIRTNAEKIMPKTDEPKAAAK